MTPKKGDHVRVMVLTHEMSGTVIGFRASEDEPEPLVVVKLDTPRASTVVVMPYKIIGLVAA